MKHLSKSLVIGLALVLLALQAPEAPALTGDTLKVENSSGWPGIGGYLIPITLKNATTLRALAFRLQANPDSLVITAVNPILRAGAYTVSMEPVAKGARILLVPTNASTPALIPDSTAILQVVVTVKDNTPGGTKATVSLDSVTAANVSNQAVTVKTKTGYFWFGTKGDVKFDESMAVDLFDVLRLIDIALGIAPPATEYELWAGDLSPNPSNPSILGDGLIDIIDISILLDMVVASSKAAAPPAASSPAVGSVRLEVVDLPQNYVGELDVPIYYRASAPISGIELVFKTDAARYQLAPPKKTLLSKNMTMQSSLRGDELHVILCSTDGKPMPAGEGELLTLPVNLLQQQTEATTIAIKHAQAGSEAASRLETIYARSNAMEVQAPDSYSLAQNSPNPFNMSTTIRYEIPASVQNALRTRVLVYNTQGRLVRTLEDRQRNAGRYTIVWNGRDDAGRYVASGIYFYKLIAGDVILTKKMAVMK